MKTIVQNHLGNPDACWFKFDRKRGELDWRICLESFLC
jgi:hypothetical protein